jgi:membrane associated rhomboid family serine protease
MTTGYKTSLVIPFRIALAMWVLFLIESLSPIDLGFLGVYPRKFTGLIGIFTSPLVHGNLHHIISNTVPLIFLGTMLFVFYSKIALRVFIQCYLFTGLLVWIFGREFYHIGASGVIYGLAFFHIFFGFFRKDFKSLAISIFVVLLYGGLVYGVLPSRYGISWESHMFGALIGIGTAYNLKDIPRVD